jgi:hypothetical protein
LQGDGSEPDISNSANINNVDPTAGNHEKRFIIVDIERPAALPTFSAPAEPNGPAAPQSESALMPPPAARTTPAAAATAAAQVPDPDTVKKMFQRMGEGGSQQAAIQSQKNTGQGKKNHVNKKEKRRWAPLVASPPARTRLNAVAFITALITA